MSEISPLVLSYSHLKDLPRANDALHSLKKIASLVKPLMRARGWSVSQLAEFYPGQHNLLGLNVNRGEKICLRLRYGTDRNQFLPIEQVVDTMLHELSHIVHGPHNAAFHALWDKLRDEHEALLMKGYTGEGFLSEGRVLGGRGSVPMQEARRLARQAAEQRRTLAAGSGQRLGGRAVRPGEDIRRVIADAAERRNRTLQGCGNTTLRNDEIRILGETATRNGFRTKAEEDAANEAAIQQALWELVEEDERAQRGTSYQPVTTANPAGSQASSELRGNVHQGAQSPALPTRPSELSHSTSSRDTESRTSPESQIVEDTRSGGHDSAMTSWACPICTLQNPLEYLCCDACGTERSEEVTTALIMSRRPPVKRQRPAVIDLTKPEPGPTGSSHRTASFAAATAKPKNAPGTSQNSIPAGPETRTWTCSFCGRKREWNYWSCDLCGKIKESS